jgi:hypothetical protein
MSEGLGAARRHARLVMKGRLRGAGTALVLVALGLLMSGCGNCDGWTNPWSRVSQPHACSSDHASEEAMAAPLGD